jgi:hypothetical protein
VFRLVRGSRADLTLFDYDSDDARISVRGTLACGRGVFGESEFGIAAVRR